MWRAATPYDFVWYSGGQASYNHALCESLTFDKYVGVYVNGVLNEILPVSSDGIARATKSGDVSLLFGACKADFPIIHPTHHADGHVLVWAWTGNPADEIDPFPRGSLATNGTATIVSDGTTYACDVWYMLVRHQIEGIQQPFLFGHGLCKTPVKLPGVMGIIVSVSNDAITVDYEDYEGAYYAPRISPFVSKYGFIIPIAPLAYNTIGSVFYAVQSLVVAPLDKPVDGEVEFRLRNYYGNTSTVSREVSANVVTVNPAFSYSKATNTLTISNAPEDGLMLIQHGDTIRYQPISNSASLILPETSGQFRVTVYGLLTDYLGRKTMTLNSKTWSIDTPAWKDAITSVSMIVDTEVNRLVFKVKTRDGADCRYFTSNDSYFVIRAWQTPPLHQLWDSNESAYIYIVGIYEETPVDPISITIALYQGGIKTSTMVISAIYSIHEINVIGMGSE